MNNFHLTTTRLGKSKGRSAVQMGAYIAGDKDFNERTGEYYDKTSKEEVSYVNMLFTENVPEELQDRSKFWNFVEMNENRANASFSRVFECSLPREGVPHESFNRMADDMAKKLLSMGYSAVQYAVHEKVGNPHIHLQCYERAFTENGELAKTKSAKGYVCQDTEGNQKTFKGVNDIPEGWERIPILDKFGEQKKDNRGRLQWKRKDMNDSSFYTRAHLKDIRKTWELIENSYIKDPALRVDCRSYAERGINRIPTKHVGSIEMAKVRAGKKSEVYEENLKIQEENEKFQEQVRKLELIRQLIESIQNRINKIRKQLIERSIENESVNIRRSYTDNIRAEIHNRRAKRREQRADRTAHTRRKDIDYSRERG